MLVNIKTHSLGHWMWGGSLNYRKSEKKRCVLPIGKPVGLITDLLMGGVLGDSLGRDRVWVLDATDQAG